MNILLVVMVSFHFALAEALNGYVRSHHFSSPSLPFSCITTIHGGQHGECALAAEAQEKFGYKRGFSLPPDLPQLSISISISYLNTSTNPTRLPVLCQGASGVPSGDTGATPVTIDKSLLGERGPKKEENPVENHHKKSHHFPFVSSKTPKKNTKTAHCIMCP